MTSKIGEKCGHQLCDCEVKAGSKYCSDSCERQEKAEPDDATGCLCGHSQCGSGDTEKKEEY